MALVSAADQDPATRKLLAESHSPLGYKDCAEHLHDRISSSAKAPAEGLAFRDILRDFIGYCGRLKALNTLPASVAEALGERDRNRLTRRAAHKALIEDLNLGPAERRKALQNMPERLEFPQLKAAYPPYGKYIYEDENVGALWADHYATGKQPDKRQPRREMHRVKPLRLQHVVEAGESCLIYDSKTKKLVGVVLRNFCGIPSVVEWVDEVIQESTAIRKSSRVSSIFASYKCAS